LSLMRRRTLVIIPWWDKLSKDKASRYPLKHSLLDGREGDH
jgi:hypothetical protein